MKKVILPFVVGCLLGGELFAQPVVRILSHRSDVYNEGAWSSTDSAYYVYSGTRGSIDAEGSAAGYDNSFTFLGSTPSWTNNQRATVTYNAGNLPIISIREKYNNGTWINDIKDSIVYDANGNTLVRASQRWDSTNHVWENYYIDSYSFNAQNKPTSHTTQDFNLLGNVFTFDTRDSFSYDVNNLVSQNINAQWNPDSAAFINVFRIDYTYNNAHKQLMDKWYNWQNSSWKDYQIDSNTYDANNNIISSVTLSWNGAMWITSQLDSNQYDASNNQILSATFLGDIAGTGWKPYQRTTKTFDGNNNAILSVYASYDTMWNNNSKIERSFNNFHKTLTRTDYLWVNNNWVGNKQYVHTYLKDTLSSTEIDYTYNSSWTPTNAYYFWYNLNDAIDELSVPIETSVYPNPTHEGFAIEFNAGKSGIATMKLHDLNGKLITTTQMNVQPGANKMAWNAFTLPAGIYLYELTLPGATGNGKIVVQ